MGEFCGGGSPWHTLKQVHPKHRDPKKDAYFGKPQLPFLLVEFNLPGPAVFASSFLEGRADVSPTPPNLEPNFVQSGNIQGLEMKL